MPPIKKAVSLSRDLPPMGVILAFAYGLGVVGWRHVS